MSSRWPWLAAALLLHAAAKHAAAAAAAAVMHGPSHVWNGPMGPAVWASAGGGIHASCRARAKLGGRKRAASVPPQIIVEDPLMRHSAVLVFANKQDLVCCTTPAAPFRSDTQRLPARRSPSCCDAGGKGGMACAQKGALSTAEVCEALGLSQMKGRRWHVQGAVAIRGEGLYEGLDW